MADADLAAMMARLRHIDHTAGRIKQTFLPMELRGELAAHTSAALADRLRDLKSERDDLARAVRDATARRGRALRRRAARRREERIAEVVDLCPDLRSAIECNLAV